MQITFDLPDGVAMGLAISQGWAPMIEDTSQPLEGDNYPMIPNPVTMEAFIQQKAPEYLSKIVLANGRQHIMDEFDSIYNSIEHQVSHGSFDEMIFAGDFLGIMAAVKANLP